MHHIAERIHSGMEAAGIPSMAALADATGIARMTLTRRFADPASFKLFELERIAAALGIPYFDLIAASAA